MLQARVGDLRATQLQLLEAGQAIEVLQVRVGGGIFVREIHADDRLGRARIVGLNAALQFCDPGDDFVGGRRAGGWGSGLDPATRSNHDGQNNYPNASHD